MYAQTYAHRLYAYEMHAHRASASRMEKQKILARNVSEYLQDTSELFADSKIALSENHHFWHNNI